MKAAYRWLKKNPLAFIEKNANKKAALLKAALINAT